ncbi:hypothetical protein HHK36_022277 [Tetracentron sinense]|uniref:Protein kinase domain-containing protein n=1 Tax=Tetracentron sinense TaxID=13715 RepID=A0A835D8N7_TETSI|nr:hypothetical protein HHK36_022277 [Tetracentron sinense]
MWSCFRILEQREEERPFLENGALLLEELITSFDSRSNPIRSFSKKELERATKNYDQHGVFHQDWSYKLYKGTYEDCAIAVKKFTSNDAPQRYIGWCINEVAVASQMNNHKNVLKLLGCCLETQVPTLVYGFATSGRLCDHIFVEELSPSYLPWESSETQVDSDVVVGYIWFVAPESVSTGRYTEKSDVHSFGVVLFEILTGKKVRDIVKEVYGVPELDLFESSSRSVNSFALLVHNYEKNIREYLKDSIVKGNTEQLMVCAELAIRCIKMNPEKRSSMMEAAKELRRITSQVPHPTTGVP